MCFKGTDFVSIFTIFRLYFGIVPKVWYVLVSLYSDFVPTTYLCFCFLSVDICVTGVLQYYYA